MLCAGWVVKMWACCSDREYYHPFSTRKHDMPTCLLYQAIGLNGYQPVADSQENGICTLRMRVPEKAVKCPGCGSTKVIRRGTLQRLVHAPFIGTCKTKAFIQAPRVECRKCQRVRTIKLPHVVPGKNHTKSFVRLGHPKIRQLLFDRC